MRESELKQSIVEEFLGCLADPRVERTRKHPLETILGYRVVSEVKVQELQGRSRASAVDAVLEREHTMLDGSLRTLSRSTVYRWLSRFEKGRCFRPGPDASSTCSDLGGAVSALGYVSGG